MTEPTTTAAAVAATVSSVTLALLGVDYYSLLYGFVGALIAMSQAQAMTRLRAVVYVILSTLVGAVLGGMALAIMESSSRPMLIFCSLIGGAGAQLFVATAIKSAVAKMEGWGGK